MKNTRRRVTLLAAVSVTAIITAACGAGESGGGSTADEGKPVKGGTLNMLGVGDVDYMDPNISYYSGGYLGLRLWSRQLFTFAAKKGATDKPALDLAADFPTTDNGGISADGKTVTIKMRDDVKWNTTPARPITAQDFVRGVKRTCNPIQPFGGTTDFDFLFEGYKKFCADFIAPYSADGAKPATPADIAKYIENTPLPGVEAKDATTIVFHLTQPAAQMVDMLTLPAFSPAPVEVLKYAPGSTELGQHQISDGPYKIDSYQPTKSISFSRNPNWDASTDPIRKAYVDKVEVNETGQQESIQQQLEADTPEADMAWDTFPPPTTVPGLIKKKDPNLSIGDTSSSNPYVIYNFASPNNNKLMSNLKFRQALSYALNRDNLVQVLGGKEVNAPLTHVLPKGIDGSQDYDPYKNNLDKAKSLMKEAGVTGNITLKFLYRNESEGSSKSFQTIQQDLSKVGITIKGVPASNADFYTKYLQVPKQARDGVWDLSLAGWGSDWYGNAALTYFRPLFYGKPSFPPNGSNFGLYDSSKANDLIDQATAAPDAADALKLWAEADKQVMDDAAFFPITNPKTANYKASHLHNAVYMEAFQQFDPANVWIDKDKQEK
jgi:peptide/nickel transport system substrate-binding protein